MLSKINKPTSSKPQSTQTEKQHTFSGGSSGVGADSASRTGNSNENLSSEKLG